jgi:hypothetical protein
MAYEPQDIFQVRNAVISDKSQAAYGTQLADVSLTHRIQFDGGSFAKISKEYRSNLERAGRGHPHPTERQEIARFTEFAMSGELTDFLAGWLSAFVMSKVTTTGAGPFTHTCIFEPTTNVAKTTTIYFQDTADVKYKLYDLSMTELTLSGSDKGPLSYSCSMVGSGKHLDGNMALPSLPTNVYLLGSDTDILFGAPAGAVSIKDRIRSWEVQISNGVTPHRAPGGGLFASGMNKLGAPRVRATITVAAKDVDDLRTLFIADTIRELQINTTSSAKQLNIKLPGLYVGDFSYAPDGQEIIATLQFGEQDIVKSGASEVIELVAVNSTTTYLVGA